jgi:hypothetical protein
LSAADSPEGFGGAQTAFEVAFKGLEGEAAEVLSAAAGKGFGGKR